MTQTAPPPAAVLAAYGFVPEAVSPILGGLINVTFQVRDAAGEPIAVLQRLHPIFDAVVNDDIAAITAHLADAGLETPTLYPTRDDARWVESDGHVWRALHFIPGRTFHRFDTPKLARSAGALVGRFHRTVADLNHTFAFSRSGVHDTPGHLARLKAAALSAPDTTVGTEAAGLAGDILSFASDLPTLGTLPQRLCHGDLKVSNIIFRGDQAVALIDLDTLGMQSLAYELGDALRSWGNPAGEDQAAPSIDMTVCEAALSGYRDTVGDSVSAREFEAVMPGLETVCTELSARFCVDVFDDSYFGWDPSRFSSRQEHNLLRARGQLSLARSVRTARG